MDRQLREIAEQARGFFPPDEADALHSAALAVAHLGPLLEVGGYCGKSAVYLGAVAAQHGTVLFSIDHHRGSEEHQAGQEFHDPGLTDDAGRVDTLPCFRDTIARAGLEESVIAVVGDSRLVAGHWRTPLAILLLDGGHSMAAAEADYEGWSPHVMRKGLLAIHDVFEDPEQGGRPPYEVWRRAVASGAFAERSRRGSLRVLERVAEDA